ncbi:MAG: hypothetical protein ABI433_03870, partial [Burkholderiaceae bacterium]
MSSSPDPVDIEALRSWVGRRETRSDLVTAAPIAALAATLDRDDATTALSPAALLSATPSPAVPPLFHWLYFLPIAPMSAVGTDG